MKILRVNYVFFIDILVYLKFEYILICFILKNQYKEPGLSHEIVYL